MNKQGFHDLFMKALNDASREAGVQNMPEDDLSCAEIELHGAGLSGAVVTVDEAVDKLYIGPDIFYLIIDVGLMRTDGHQPRFFVRPSDHPPGRFEATWNQPEGNGPFKIITPAR